MAENKGMDNKIILASRSLARRCLLEAAGIEFDCMPADLDEEKTMQELLSNGFEIEKIALALARAKALYVAKDNPGAHVIGADQTLDLDGEILSKADSVTDAKDKLKRLRGKTHRLVSAACVAHGEVILWEAQESAELTMKNFDDDFLDDYCEKAGAALMRSVGAYEIEDEGAKLFSEIKGDTNTIQGLPLSALLDYLRKGCGA